MKLAVVLLLCLEALGQAQNKPTDPCENRASNLEMRKCYATAEANINAEAESLAGRIATAFKKESDDPENDGVIRELMQKASSALVESEKSWKEYRDQHCRAVQFSWTTGSGAGTAYESCLYNLATQRVQDLRSDFGAYLK
jgi:uncharacterized protein YecT (DUF1311 family)